MKLDYKGLAVIILVIGVVVAGSYTLGMKQGQQTATVQAPAQQPASQAQAPTSQVPAGQAGQSRMPAGHPGGTSNMRQRALDANQQSRAAQSMDVRRSSAANFTHFRVGNRNVKGMVADGDQVWVGTSGGVIRYDINSDDYKLFDVNNGSLISNGVFHVSKLEDKVVVGTYGGGMSIYTAANKNWRNYNIPDGLADQFVYDIVKADNGDYWIATWSGANLVKGGKMDDASAWQTFTVANTNGGLPNDWVYGVEKGKNGDLWFATEGGLALYRDGKWTNWNHEKGLGASYETVKKDIGFTNDPAKMSQHHKRQKTEQGLQDVQVGFNPNYIVSLAVDNDGIIWCGTWGGGLAKFDGKTWTNYTTLDGLPGNHVFMLKVDEQDGRLWIGTNKGLARFKADGKGFSVMTKNDGLFADNVFSMAKAKDGTLWVGSFGGVARLKDVKL